jgi:hypothetical protein
MFRCAALATLALTALAGPALAQEVNLQWKLNKGDKFYLEEKIVSETMVTVLGNKNTEKQTQHRISSFEVKSIQPDGTIVLEQRIESWKLKIVGGPPGTVDDGGKLLEQVFNGITFVVKMNKAGVITKFEGYDMVVQRVKQINPAEAEQFKQMATEDVLRSPLTMAFDVLPDKAVKKGDKWKKVNEVPMGTLGKFIFTTDLTYEGKGEGHDLISTKGVFTFQAGKGGDIGMGVKLLKMELTKNQQTGKVVFDAVKGRLVLKEISMPLAGTMTMEAMGLQLDVQLEGTENRTIRLHDKKPLPDV